MNLPFYYQKQTVIYRGLKSKFQLNFLQIIGSNFLNSGTWGISPLQEDGIVRIEK